MACAYYECQKCGSVYDYGYRPNVCTKCQHPFLMLHQDEWPEQISDLSEEEQEEYCDWAEEN